MLIWCLAIFLISVVSSQLQTKSQECFTNHDSSQCRNDFSWQISYIYGYFVPLLCKRLLIKKRLLFFCTHTTSDWSNFFSTKRFKFATVSLYRAVATFCKLWEINTKSLAYCWVIPKIIVTVFSLDRGKRMAFYAASKQGRFLSFFSSFYSRTATTKQWRFTLKNYYLHIPDHIELIFIAQIIIFIAQAYRSSSVPSSSSSSTSTVSSVVTSSTTSSKHLWWRRCAVRPETK